MSVINQTKKIGVDERGKAKYKLIYRPVSSRDVSFRKRGIKKDLFITILTQIRRPLNKVKTYAKIKDSESVESLVNAIMNTTSLRDPNYEIAVFQERTDMSDTEAFYYYLRNSFAHGSFEVIPSTSGNVYKLESSKDGTIKSQMRLKETSLLEYIRLANLTATEIKDLQKSRY